jgi:TRAP-type C4-dicarboxylate transport system substrate-binding protein
MPPAQAALAKSFDFFLDDIEKRSGGRIKIERYYSASLAKPHEMLEACGIGVFDIFTMVSDYYPGKVPLATVGGLIGAADNVWVTGKAYLEMQKTYPVMEKEMMRNNVKCISAWGSGTFYLLSNKKIQSLEALKGKKIGSASMQAKLMKALGATPVSLSFNDAFTALQRGTVDGGIFGPDAILAFGLHEAGKYYYKIAVGGGVQPVAMNLDKWNSLPADIQKIILEAGEDFPKSHENFYQLKATMGALGALKGKGVIITEPSAETKAALKKISQEKVWTQWAKGMDAKGLPGSKTMDIFLKGIEKYSAMHSSK